LAKTPIGTAPTIEAPFHVMLDGLIAAPGVKLIPLISKKLPGIPTVALSVIVGGTKVAVTVDTVGRVVVIMVVTGVVTVCVVVEVTVVGGRVVVTFCNAVTVTGGDVTVVVVRATVDVTGGTVDVVVTVAVPDGSVLTAVFVIVLGGIVVVDIAVDTTVVVDSTVDVRVIVSTGNVIGGSVVVTVLVTVLLPCSAIAARPAITAMISTHTIGVNHFELLILFHIVLSFLYFNLHTAPLPLQLLQYSVPAPSQLPA
jgi:hypothetical protein